MSQDPNANHPYASTFGDQAASLPPKKSTNWGCILGVIALVGLLGVGVCCGGGYFIVNKGMNAVGQQLANRLQQRPDVVEKMGEVKSASMDFMAIGNHPTNQNPDPDSPTQVIVFRVEGAKQSGTLEVEIRQGDDPTNVKDGILKLDNGETITFGNGVKPRPAQQ